MSDLSNIAIGIRTFLRDEHLYHAVAGIQDTMPGVQIIIADCGERDEQKDGVYAYLERKGHRTIQLPFDAGFGAMSNAIVDNLNRPYLLIGSDDFDFSPVSVRAGIEKLEQVLKLNPDIDIASGRVNGREYEFDLIEDDGVITEVKSYYPRIVDLWFFECDLTVNYSLIRRDVFQKVRWDEPLPKIGGGEHGAFFLDCKRQNVRTVCVMGADIPEQQIPSSPRYRQLRSRANSPDRPCFLKRGIKKYILGDGRVDYQT